MKNVILTLTLLITTAAQADACSRCGFRVCKYTTQAVVAAPVVAAAAPVYVVQNNYPAQALVGQGSSAVISTPSYNTLVAPLDLNAYFSQEQQLQAAADKYAADRHSQALQALTEAAKLNAPYAEILARGHAVSQTLVAGGFTNQPQTQALLISNGKVYPVPAGQVQALTAITTTTQSFTATTGPQALASQSDYPMLNQFCGKCHGTNITSPKGGLFLGDDDNVAKTMKEKFFEISHRTTSEGQGHMPPMDQPQPSKEQLGMLLNEVEQIILRRKK